MEEIDYKVVLKMLYAIKEGRCSAEQAINTIIDFYE